MYNFIRKTDVIILNNFAILGFFVKNLENIKLQIERSTKENIDNEKKLASEVWK